MSLNEKKNFPMRKSMKKKKQVVIMRTLAKIFSL
jgi:histidinol-phosphate/aromatic aminotransferase/cobyric acid decarboxylase-like protein